MAYWKSCIGCWERFGAYILSGGVLANTQFAIFAIIVLSTKTLFASTSCLVHYQGSRESFGAFLSSGGVLANTHFDIFASTVLSTKKLYASTSLL